MGSQEFACKACDGSGLLMDDEQWQYTCTICHGDGFVAAVEKTEKLQVDENNRVID
ncbi:hypothetical protein [Oceanobacillus sp. J11TS1]|uniref:hypothetical protein n=1 Tax=Oceanobacillus sp. J11TS1 TaxID=2807191 RepID=UPI001B2C23E7|nr:hypothetical protein [Oceanobacillus sp. J11TS1]GIO24293.1 hypothetical protein J11TS1_28740 [Oceanobacillus sp. J11TS1]